MTDALAREQPPCFDDAFRRQLQTLLRWRRDVRRFRPDPVDPAVVEALIIEATLAPSVGNSQPWRFVTVSDPARRVRIVDIFQRCNGQALAGYGGERARLYAGHKHAGLREAPVHLAVYADAATEAGHGLGRRTMPETLIYAVVGCVTTLWLAARARGIGMGWVSIVDPPAVTEALDVPAEWTLIAYLCLGHPEEEHSDPELERAGWQERQDPRRFIVER